MKLQDLAATAQTKQVAKVMESYFGQSVNFDKLSRSQARNMLNRVRAMISEHRRSPDFHSSEQNPAYLKLVMMEQGLCSRIKEQTVAGTVATAAPAQSPAQAAALQAAQQQQRRRQIQDQIKAVDQQEANLRKQRNDLQKQLSMAEGAVSLRQRLKEASEVQQAQVVLASKDMVDQVQGMIEDASAMQFKDLPALVDQIRNEVGYEQATQFNADATAALSGLVQNLQASKGQLEQALGVVTGQAPTIPGQELAQPAPAEELPAVDGEEEIDLDIDAEEEPETGNVGLGRAKR